MTSRTVSSRIAAATRRIASLVDRVPLRVRLVGAVLALVAVAQVTTGAVAVAALDRYLTARLDRPLVRDIVTHVALIDAVASGAVLVLLGGLAYLLVRASLRPLGQVEAVASAVAEGRLGQRVPERDPRTEVGHLSRSLNAMLARVEDAFRDREASEAQARASEQRMRRFIADASHELRTPLTSIRGFAELYRQGAASSAYDVSWFMRRIEVESYRMGLLVEDLLLLARLDQRRALRRRPVDVAAVAAHAVRDARAVAPDRRIELRTSGACVVNGDPLRLRQVVANLVSNALTHTPAGTPVTVTVTRDDGSAILLEVADDGPGMAPEHAARAFECFYRADASRARHTGGNGLGLAVVAAVVAAHGGTVGVKTAPGSGATFRVRLRAPTHSPTTARCAHPARRSAVRSP
ncbi:sensor histidine kinase [Planosporangium flavigriseum]|uniref:histidine kinase n=1 Tax=Planosporangium flavigriseum TaxID=373681 RepID=A0A8J3PIX0_9ACTN|nr:HAMP domain-containing sensor histidine kinase [Planosporangium flavigriseum]GIG71671.1 hypothetical protein Pfl04_00750 [Planosporangium flavigriseum]